MAHNTGLQKIIKTIVVSAKKEVDDQFVYSYLLRSDKCVTLKSVRAALYNLYKDSQLSKTGSAKFKGALYSELKSSVPDVEKVFYEWAKL